MVHTDKSPARVFLICNTHDLGPGLDSLILILGSIASNNANIAFGIKKNMFICKYLFHI